MMPTVDKYIKFENGSMSNREVVDFFASLVRTGVAWSLQGSYGRIANDLIDHGYIDRKGNIKKYPEAWV